MRTSDSSAVSRNSVIGATPFFYIRFFIIVDVVAATPGNAAKAFGIAMCRPIIGIFKSIAAAVVARMKGG